jgi:hypothetical protein
LEVFSVPRFTCSVFVSVSTGVVEIVSVVSVVIAFLVTKSDSSFALACSFVLSPVSSANSRLNKFSEAIRIKDLE